ncbi:MAG: choice-of-anchor D domain-containing protein [bacterium]
MTSWIKLLIFAVVFAFPLTPYAQIVINEIHADPAPGLEGDANNDGVRSADNDEFVELVNSSASDIDISGWTLSDAQGVRHTFPNGTIVPGKCAIVVFGGGSPSGSFGGAIVQTTGSLGLNNTGDTVTLNDGASEVASVTYGSEANADQSLTRDPDMSGSEPLVQHTSASGAGGRLFSPGTKATGAPFSGCSAPGTGSIRVTKVTAPAGGAGFSFTGDLGDFTLNDGDETQFENLLAGDYSLTETVPAGWALDDVQVTGAGSTQITSGVTVHLQAGEEATVTFTNLALPDTTADLQVAKTDDDDPVFAGGNITYTVTVTNSGPSSAENVVLVDSLPGGATFVATDHGAESNDVVMANLGDLASGASVEVEIVVQADGEGTLTNKATVSSDTDDPDDTNNHATEQTTVESLPGTSVIINEVDADTPGSDDLEFIELFDGGGGHTGLSGLVVVLFNGSSDASYATFDLDGKTTDADGFFVLGNAGVQNVDLTFSNNKLQNGADAVALYFGDAADFPNGTPVTLSGLVDAVVYDTDDANDPGLLVLLHSGQPQVNENGAGDKDQHSIQRIPNGAGGPRNSAQYLAIPPTPGAENTGPPVPDIAVEPTSLDFGDLEAGQELDINVVVRNEGGGNLAVDSTIIAGPDAEQWQVTEGAAPFTLASGEARNVQVCFNPTSGGEKNAVLRIRSNDPDEDPFEVVLTGKGLAPDIAGPKRNLRFGPVDIGSQKQKSFALRNDGNEALSVTRIAIGGSHGEQYELVEKKEPFTLQPGESKRFKVIFAPDTVGILRGRVRFYSNDPDEPRFAVGMRGDGRVNPDLDPDIAVEPASLDFGAVQLGAGVERTVMVRNDSLGMLEVDTTEITGTAASDWQMTSGGAPFSLLAGEVHTIKLRFVPGSEGAKEARLSIHSNDPDEATVSVSLRGTGVAASGTSPFDSVVVINEIHYNPATSQGSDRQLEFLELHNTSETDVDLAGFAFSAGINHTFQAGDTLRASSLLVLASDSTSYPGSIQWTSGNLVNTGELLKLLDAGGALVDSVRYGVALPWPSEPNGAGPSLELRDPALNNSLAENWQASLIPGGTPGAENSNPSVVEPDIFVNPTELSYGEVEIGSSSDLQVAVTNLGAEELQVTTSVIAGPDADLWEITEGAAPFALSTGQSQTLTLRFSPTSEGQKRAQLELSSNDPDEPTVAVSLTGMGVTTTASPFAGMVVINELHYNPGTGQGSDNDFEFLELANASGEDIDLAGLSFARGIVYAFQAGDVLPANGFLVLARNGEMYEGSIEWTSGNLVNTGERVQIVDADGLTVDAVEYGVRTPWPSAPNGGGPSLELIDVALDNSKPENWQASAGVGGTPDEPNSGGGFVAPDIAVEPVAHDFGVLNLNQLEPLVVTIINEGGAALHVSEIALTGADTVHFALEGARPPLRLAPGDSRDFIVQARPAATGTKKAQLRIASNAPADTLVLVVLSMFVNSPPLAPSPVYPDWGAAADRLVWRQADDSDAGDEMSYRVEIAQEEQFSDLVFSTAAISDTSLVLSDLASASGLEVASFYYWRVQATDNHGAVSEVSPAGYFQYSANPTAVDGLAPGLPERFTLAQNYPNPFNPETQIRYEMPRPATVSLTVFDIKGQQVRKLVNRRNQKAGTHSVSWDGRDDSGVRVTSGTYFYRLVLRPQNTASMTFVRKMVFLK